MRHLILMQNLKELELIQQYIDLYKHREILKNDNCTLFYLQNQSAIKQMIFTLMMGIK